MKLTVAHDGKKWIAYDEKVRFEGETLESLDAKVKEFVRENLFQGEEYRVWMYFNNALIPQWMRQYMQHYFNRVLIVT